MLSWRDRLCGSLVPGRDNKQIQELLKRFACPTRTLSCGGAFLRAEPVPHGAYRLDKNFLLPTRDYSVLILRNDGSVVIYSDSEPQQSVEDLPCDVFTKQPRF